MSKHGRNDHGRRVQEVMKVTQPVTPASPPTTPPTTPAVETVDAGIFVPAVPGLKELFPEPQADAVTTPAPVVPPVPTQTPAPVYDISHNRILMSNGALPPIVVREDADPLVVEVYEFLVKIDAGGVIVPEAFMCADQCRDLVERLRKNLESA